MHDTLPFARFRFSFRVTTPISLPDYAGSTLRGAFGQALRHTACMTKRKDCHECPLYRSCPFTRIFTTPAPENHALQKFSQIPNGYIIEPPSWGKQEYQAGEILTFHLVLVGQLIKEFPLICYAFERAFAHRIGASKGQAVLCVLEQQTSSGWQDILATKTPLENADVALKPNLSAKVSIEIETPLRIQQNGKPLRATTLTAERFFLTLAKRVSLLAEFHAIPLDLDFAELKAELAQIQEKKTLRWQDWTRYSSRQKQRMALGGVVGEWQFDGLSPAWQRLLYLGQWLHCGKNATFGLGKYQCKFTEQA